MVMIKMEAKERIKQFNRMVTQDDDDVLFIERLKASGFSEEQIVKIIDVMEGICHECWDNDKGCHCWDDSLR